MTLQQYVDEIKLKLTGGILKIELTDTQIAAVVTASLREIQRYINVPKYVTVPFAKCIDLTDFKHDSILKVYRTVGYSGNGDIQPGVNDPMYMQQWMIYSGGASMYNLNNYLMNFLSYNTLLQMRNTISTDLNFIEDKKAKKLYINAAYDRPEFISIEYIPIYDTVEEIEDGFWIDILMRMSIANTKQILGRIRTKYSLSNASWGIDGQTMLEEGNKELDELRANLQDNMMIVYPKD